LCLQALLSWLGVRQTVKIPGRRHSQNESDSRPKPFSPRGTDRQSRRTTNLVRVGGKWSLRTASDLA
jgi:hypothetical protein